jgi:hypothetical protein
VLLCSARRRRIGRCNMLSRVQSLATSIDGTSAMTRTPAVDALGSANEASTSTEVERDTPLSCQCAVSMAIDPWVDGSSGTRTQLTAKWIARDTSCMSVSEV